MAQAAEESRSRSGAQGGKTLMNPNELPEETIELGAPRPQNLEEFDGQTRLKQNLAISIRAARNRGEPLDHCIFYGPPGLGKTTLARIVANEMGFTFKQTSAPAINRAGDLAALLTTVEPWQVLFIDEIHRLNAQVEEMLYSAMEDFRLDLVVGEGMDARSVSLDLPPFTLVGATTRPDALTGPLRDRFGIQLKLEYYAPSELKTILLRSARKSGEVVEDSALEEIANRARGTPRIAHRIHRRVRDFAHQDATPRPITLADAREALAIIGVDEQGLDRQDLAYMRCIAEFYSGGPAGIETIAASLNENAEVFETIVEPYLMSLGFIQRTPRGRILSARGYEALNILPPNRASSEMNTPILFLDTSK